MTLFKIPLRNIRRSLRDYAIYFFTLIIGVSIFYVFNAIGGQAAMMQISSSRGDIVKLLQTTLSGVSAFVAVILALLIVYASRFLMKRRSREFALYMLLGMSKRSISAILLMETIIIGIGSLAVGLILGIGLSQFMSALVVNLFEADMTAYKLTVSGRAIGMTILFFAVMYLVVMVFNSGAVTKMKLIDLIQSGKKSEKLRLKNPVLCVVAFGMAVILLGYSYYRVGWDYGNLNQKNLVLFIGIGVLSTFLIFWSVAGSLLRIMMHMKKTYFRGLNSFTFRQISSKVGTMVIAMTVICLMLFVTICALTTAFSVRNSINANLKDLCPADAQIQFTTYVENDEDLTYEDLSDVYTDHGFTLTEGFRDYVHFKTYGDYSLTLAKSLGTHLDEMRENYRILDYEGTEEIVRVSDYNELMKLYGRDPVSLADDEYILICDFKSMKEVRDEALASGTEITVFGQTLRPKYRECQDGFISISAQHLNTGVYIVPDDAVSDDGAKWDYFIGNYNADTKEEIEIIEQEQRDRMNAVIGAWKEEHKDVSCLSAINTRLDIYNAAIGLGAILAFLGLYIGLVFLVACGAILALKELSESVDSISKYEILRKIGVEETDITSSLFRQIGIFFLLPLILAAIHSVFGMKLATQMMETFGTDGMWESIGLTSIILLVIYGGYFLITFFNSKWIIKGREV